jgi:hypothetical protein
MTYYPFFFGLIFPEFRKPCPANDNAATKLAQVSYGGLAKTTGYSVRQVENAVASQKKKLLILVKQGNLPNVGNTNSLTFGNNKTHECNVYKLLSTTEEGYVKGG